jgi:hypothetical protein
LVESDHHGLTRSTFIVELFEFNGRDVPDRFQKPIGSGDPARRAGQAVERKELAAVSGRRA